MARNTKRLPDEYEEVKYLQPLNSSSHVMSGIQAVNCKSALVRLTRVSGSGDTGIFGAGSWSLTGFIFAFTGQYQLYSNNAYANYTGVDIGEGVLEFDLQPTTGTAQNTTSIVQIFNFFYKNVTFRLHHVVFFGNNGELVAEFVPCYRKVDNICGFFDVKNGAFREGTGSFTYAAL